MSVAFKYDTAPSSLGTVGITNVRQRLDAVGDFIARSGGTSPARILKLDDKAAASSYMASLIMKSTHSDREEKNKRKTTRTMKENFLSLFVFFFFFFSLYCYKSAYVFLYAWFLVKNQKMRIVMHIRPAKRPN